MPHDEMLAALRSRDWLPKSPLGREDCELVEYRLSFSDARGRFVSEYIFRYGRGGDRIAAFTIAEAGRLKVEGIEFKEPKTQ